MDLWTLFQEPTSEFRQAPFWFWNHELDTDTLDWQIEQMKEKGLGGFVMHARHGLITPYLSDAWFDCIRFSCGKARELGMIAWAYDERDWPSGPAGGKVIENHANRLSYVRCATKEIEGPCTLPLDKDVVCAYCGRHQEPLRRVEGKVIELGEGPWRVARIIRFECPAILWFDSYLDTLDRRACAEFIKSTYDLHEKKLGDLKALGLAGFFTDEPALSTYPDDLGRIPWTADFASAFLDRKGYDLLENLPKLFLDEDGTSGITPAQVRYDYWDVACTLFENAYFKSLEDWCGSRGLQLIGHALGEEPLFFQFRCLGNIFYYLKHLHMPGLDHLTIHVGKGGPGSMSPKMVESAALLAGRERTMTETFGCGGWGLTMRDMKWMCDWQIAHGINYIIPHAFFYTVAGRRKKDAPPTEFFQSPFWPYYRYFADYTARITAAMTGGTHVAKIAVLFPMSSVWTDFIPGQEVSESVLEMEKAFFSLGETLLRLHRDFVVIDESSLETWGRHASLQFEALVLPSMTSIRSDAFEAIERIGRHCPVVATFPGPLKVIQTGELTSMSTVVPSAIPGTVIAEPTDAGLAAALADIRPDVIIENAPDVYYLHRRKEDKDLFFFANTAQTAVEIVISLETIGLAEIWDPETGEKRPAPGQQVVDGRLRVPASFAGTGSMLLVVDPAQPAVDAPVEVFHPSRRIKLCEDLWHFTPQNGNFLTLNRWSLEVQARSSTTELHYTTQFMMPEQLGNLRLILDGVPRHAYRVQEAVRPMMAGETDAIVLLDGQPLDAELPWEIDPQFRVLDLRGRCRPGTHTIEIVIKNNGWFPQPGIEEYAWLAGDFRLDPSGGIPCLTPIRGIKAGPWEEQGHPYFSGTGAYYGEIIIERELVGRRIFLDAVRVGDLLELEVNTQTVGIRPWPPYRIEITRAIEAGTNQFLLRVTNSARNFFEGPDLAKPSGLLEDVWLEID